MTILLLFFLTLAVIGCLVLLVLWLREHHAASRVVRVAEEAQNSLQARYLALDAEYEKLRNVNARLAKW